VDSGPVQTLLAVAVWMARTALVQSLLFFTEMTRAAPYRRTHRPSPHRTGENNFVAGRALDGAEGVCSERRSSRTPQASCPVVVFPGCGWPLGWLTGEGRRFT
jgi:hypothetical protein